MTVGSQILGSALELWEQMSRCARPGERCLVYRSTSLHPNSPMSPSPTRSLRPSLQVGCLPNMLQFELTDSVGPEQAEYVRVEHEPARKLRRAIRARRLRRPVRQLGQLAGLRR